MKLTGMNLSKNTGIVAAQTAIRLLGNDTPPGAFENLDVELGKNFE